MASHPRVLTFPISGAGSGYRPHPNPWHQPAVHGTLDRDMPSNHKSLTVLPLIPTRSNKDLMSDLQICLMNGNLNSPAWTKTGFQFISKRAAVQGQVDASRGNFHLCAWSPRCEQDREDPRFHRRSTTHLGSRAISYTCILYHLNHCVQQSSGNMGLSNIHPWSPKACITDAGL